jgi:LPS export ABC transporter protein LptC
MPATGFLAQANYPLQPITLLLFAFFMSATSCRSMSDYDRDAINQALADSTSYATETWGVRMDIMEDGLRLIQITSPFASTIETHTGTETTLIGPLTIQIRDTTGANETVVTTDKAIYQARQGIFVLKGNVIVSTIGERVLRTEELIWNQHQRSVSTDRFVTITTAQDSIAGHGLSGDDRLETYVIERVTGTFTLETSSRQD